MTFREFVESCKFEIAVTNAKKGIGNFPMVENVCPKLLNSLRRGVRNTLEPKDIRARLLDLCGREFMPVDLSYYLVDDIVLDFEEDGGLLVRWFSQFEDRKLDMAVFRLQTKEFSLCGQPMSFVEGIEFVSAIHEDIAETVLDVLSRQNATGNDLFDRWCFAGSAWREAHLICPSCGEPIAPYMGEDRMMHSECQDCGWESKKRYYGKSGFADITAMKAERKRRKKELRQEESYKDLYKKMANQIDAFGTAALHESVKSHLFSQYLRSIRDAQTELKKIEEAMLLKQKR